ncbi:MAG: HDIG domain-containing protein [Prevotellaceae bacterium]|jgi:putative nucleotidyltransferase with HDIG domain|nr:HDIG domain-containing protein [Prevotellaceae bacterium]
MEFIKRHRNILPFIVATLLITYIMPRGGKFQYEFQKGKLWQYPTLSAAFDFPIYKSDEELAAERKQTLATLTPFYKRDSSVQRAQVAEIGSAFHAALSIKDKLNEAEKFTEHQYSYLTIDVLRELQRRVDFIYRKGIREPNSVAEGYLNREQATLMVQSGAVSELAPSAESFTPKSAYAYLAGKLQPLWEENSAEQKFFEKLELQSLLKPNLLFDEQLTAQARQQRLADIAPTKGVVNAGQQIVAQGEVVNAHAYLMLASLRKEYELRMGYAGSLWLLFLAQLLLTLFFMATLYLYIYMLGEKKSYSFKQNSFLMLLMLSFFALAVWLSQTGIASVHIIPFAILPIFVNTFFNARLALVTHYLTTALTAFMLPNSFDFFLLTGFAGTAAVFSMRHMYQRRKLYQTMAIVFVSYCLLAVVLALIKDDGNLGAWRTYAMFAVNVGLMLAAYQLVYPFEKIFGFTSDNTLLEISDTNHALLRELAEVAPASFQHSLQVANLAESVIREVGGKPLLVRAGALYHDVGKINNPSYFVENQTTSYSPHQQLQPEQSATIIVQHVADGIAIARKHRLPEVIVNFIRTHHGLSLVRYFYRQYMEKHPEATDCSAFQYPGPNPGSKEQGVLMMADAVEAASRTLSDYTPHTIDELVENVVNSQLNGKMLDNTDLTMNDISTAKAIFKKKLQNIYHDRAGAKL